MSEKNIDAEVSSIREDAAIALLAAKRDNILRRYFAAKMAMDQLAEVTAAGGVGAMCSLEQILKRIEKIV